MVRKESEWDTQKAVYEERIKLLQQELQRVPKVPLVMVSGCMHFNKCTLQEIS